MPMSSGAGRASRTIRSTRWKTSSGSSRGSSRWARRASHGASTTRVGAGSPTPACWPTSRELPPKPSPTRTAPTTSCSGTSGTPTSTSTRVRPSATSAASGSCTTARESSSPATTSTSPLVEAWGNNMADGFLLEIEMEEGEPTDFSTTATQSHPFLVETITIERKGSLPPYEIEVLHAKPPIGPSLGVVVKTTPYWAERTTTDGPDLFTFSSTPPVPPGGLHSRADRAALPDRQEGGRPLGERRPQLDGWPCSVTGPCATERQRVARILREPRRGLGHPGLRHRPARPPLRRARGNDSRPG